MRITKVKGTNVKGRTFEYPIGPATLIYGGNYTGKTAIVTAIRLALAGHLPPPIGKQPQAIYNALAGNPSESGEMTVAVVANDNDGRNPTLYETKWIRSGRKTTTSGGIGPERALPPILIDPRTFFGASGPERMRAVFEACNVKVAKSDIAGVIDAAAPGIFPIEVRREVQRVAKVKLDAIWAINSLQPHVVMREVAQAVKEMVKEWKPKLETVEIELGTMLWSGDIPKDVEGEVMRLEEEIQELATQEAEIRSALERSKATTARNAEIEQALARHRADIELNTWEAEPVMPSDEDLKSAKGALEKVLARNAELQSARAAITDRLRAVSSGKCPTCGCAGEGLEALRGTLEAELAAVPPDFNPNPTRKNIVLLESEYNQALQERTRYNASMQLVGVARREIDRLLTQLKKPEIDGDGQVMAAVKLTNIVNRWEKARAAASLFTDARVLWESYKQMVARRESAEKQRGELQVKVSVGKAIIDDLTSKMEQAIRDSFGRVMNDTRAFTEGILNSPLEYDEELGRRVSHDDVAMGCQAKVGSWISHEAFSGTEEALAYAAFSVAMAMRSSFRLVIMDELGRMDTETRARVLDRMVHLVDVGDIDQFIGIDTIRPHPEIEGIDYIQTREF